MSSSKKYYRKNQIFFGCRDIFRNKAPCNFDLLKKKIFYTPLNHKTLLSDINKGQ